MVLDEGPESLASVGSDGIPICSKQCDGDEAGMEATEEKPLQQYLWSNEISSGT